MFFADLAIARSSYFLIREAKKHKADLYIGHNLGALPAVVKTAKKYDKPCGFDAEDFHRMETEDNLKSAGTRLKIHTENKYMPQLRYLTTSSPEISNEYQRLYPQVKKDVILNAFPKKNISPANNKHPNIRLFWFSQTVGIARGIESVIKALQLLKDQPFELHLLGEASDDIRSNFSKQLLKTLSSIHFHPPIASDTIIEFAAQFDIGLALENNLPFNRNICLTNKFFTYIQAGMPVIASNTKAQAAFMKQSGVAGRQYQNNNVASLANALMYYINNRNILESDKARNYLLGQTYINWDTEKKKLLRIINQILPLD